MRLLLQSPTKHSIAESGSDLSALTYDGHKAFSRRVLRSGFRVSGLAAHNPEWVSVDTFRIATDADPTEL